LQKIKSIGDTAMPDAATSVNSERDNGTASQQTAIDVNSGKTVASAALIGAGLLVEPELLGGALLAAGAIYGIPLLGNLLRPVTRFAIRAGYSAVNLVGEAMNDARESVGQIVSEARSDYRHGESSIISPSGH
jgi:hypothetical protein